METGRLPAPTRSLVGLPPTRPSVAAPAATSGAWPAGADDAAIERCPSAAGGRPPAGVRSCAARPALRSVRHVGCASCPPVRCLPSGRTIGLRCRPSPQVLTLDRRGRPPYLHQRSHPRPHEELALACRAAEPDRGKGLRRCGSRRAATDRRRNRCDRWRSVTDCRDLHALPLVLSCGFPTIFHVLERPLYTAVMARWI
jgi:hypothetical protein